MRNSEPVSSNQTLTVQEDVPFDLTASIDVTDFDSEYYTMPDITDPGAETKLIIVRTLPEAGNLYAGKAQTPMETLVTPGDLPFTPPADKQLYYLTEPNEPGTNTPGYASFTFAVSDGEFTSDDYVVTINANTVQDGPETTNEEIVVFRGVPTEFTVTGADPDVGAAHSQFSCVFPVLPAGGGALSREPGDTPCFGVDPALDDPTDTLIRPDSTSVLATFTAVYTADTMASADEDQGLQVIGSDSFSYRAYDGRVVDGPSCAPPPGTAGSPSAEDGLVNVTVLNHMQTSDQLLAANEDQNTTLALTGTDQMKLAGVGANHPNPQLVLETLPANGVLYLPDSSTAAAIDTALASLSLDYVPGPENWYGNTTFQFHIRGCNTLACDDQVYRSSSHTATIQVASVDDPAELSIIVEDAELNEEGLWEFVSSTVDFTELKKFTTTVEDIDKEGAEYTVRIKSQPVGRSTRQADTKATLIQEAFLF